MSDVKHSHPLLTGCLHDFCSAQLRPGTLAHGSVWFVVGAESAHHRGSNVRIFSLSINPGEEVMSTLRTFLASSKGEKLHKCFLFSALGILKTVTYRVLQRTAAGEEDYRCHSLAALPDAEGYQIERMTALFGSGVACNTVHVTIVLPPPDGEELGYSVGGELVEAVVAGDSPLDLCVGEVIAGEGIDFPFDEP